MAKINDTTTYLNTTPAMTDHVLGTDVSNTTNDVNGESATFLWSAVKTLYASFTETLTNKTINTASNTITVVEADISDLGTYSTATGVENNADVTDATNVEAAGAVMDADVGVSVQAYDTDTLKADTADVLTAGFAHTVYDAGTKSSGTYTPDEANGSVQKAVNGGAHTIAPPTNDGTLVIQYTNNASAGAVTTTGFTLVDGDTISTTNGDDFFFSIIKANGFSSLTVKALQ